MLPAASSRVVSGPRQPPIHARGGLAPDEIGRVEGARAGEGSRLGSPA